MSLTLDVSTESLGSPGRALSERASWEVSAERILVPRVEEFLSDVRRLTSASSPSSILIPEIVQAWTDAVSDPDAGPSSGFTSSDGEVLREVQRILDERSLLDSVIETVQATREAVSPGELADALETTLALETPSAVLASLLAAGRKNPFDRLTGLDEGGPHWLARVRRKARSIATVAHGISSVRELEAEGRSYKRWVTRRDEVVRSSHAAVDGRRIPVRSSFRVGTSSLYVPGDRRAPLDETINCRCVVVGA